MRQTRALSCCQAGFTLLELLVALVILSLGLAALTHTVSDSLSRATEVRREAQMAEFAQSLLARLGADLPLREGTQSGRDDNIEWTLTVQPLGSAEDRAAWPTGVEQITLTLASGAAGRRRSAVWQTLRPASLPPP